MRDHSTNQSVCKIEWLPCLMIVKYRKLYWIKEKNINKYIQAEPIIVNNRHLQTSVNKGNQFWTVIANYIKYYPNKDKYNKL